ncbi:MAG TPA: ABC transporter substrate-binding protein [Candidatus Binataceae bacterium]|nr:ABC transporter substrate-binding protein [Candidatus Binataceae bacterium]
MESSQTRVTSNRKPMGSLKLAAGLAIAAIAAVMTIAAPSRAANSPSAVVQGLVNQALGVLRDNSMPISQKQDRLRGLVAQTFDFTEMARSALGTHWRDLNSDQKADFTRVFTQFIEDSYLSKISEYKGQTVTFTKTIQLAAGYTQVNSQIVQPNGEEPIALDYRLRFENGEWRIYDVTVDAISIVANYRNQFNRVINDKGFATLMADLRAKSSQLANSPAAPDNGR